MIGRTYNTVMYLKLFTLLEVSENIKYVRHIKPL